MHITLGVTSNNGSQSQLGFNTPWGQAQEIEHLDEGMVLVGTASHRGLMVDNKAFQTLPAPVRCIAVSFGDWHCYEQEVVERIVFKACPGMFNTYCALAIDFFCSSLGQNDLHPQESINALTKVQILFDALKSPTA